MNQLSQTAKSVGVSEAAFSTSRDVPTVSVVVPSYNHAAYVAFCLRSIMQQTLSPLELLVIDDGSIDDSPKIIEQVLLGCSFRSELIVRENRGLSVTLNQGLTRVSGKYFAYLGSDDVWLPNFLAERTTLLQRRPGAVLGYGHAYLIDERNNIIDCTSHWADYLDGNVQNMLLRTTAPMSPTVLYDREALARHGWNEQSRLEDYELYLRLSSEGEFAFDPSVLAAWRWHQENASWNQEMMLAEQLAAQHRVREQLKLGYQELEKLQRQIRFHRAEDFLRLGDKSRALALMLENLRGANSPFVIARMLVRLLIPNAFMQMRQQKRHNRNIARFGSIKI